jgi:hypothetical protein
LERQDLTEIELENPVKCFNHLLHRMQASDLPLKKQILR